MTIDKVVRDHLRFGARSDTDEVLAAIEAFRADQVGEEVADVAAEARDVARSNERVDSLRAVAALVEREVVAGDCWSGNGYGVAGSIVGRTDRAWREVSFTDPNMIRHQVI